MKVGLLNITSARIGDRDHTRVLREWIDHGIAAEQLGFWSYWTTQHHFGSDPEYRPFGLTTDEYPATDYDLAADPLTLITYLAAKTSTLRFGTAVTVLHWDHPVRLAEQAAMLDALSDGRLELGIGRGNGFREQVVFDVIDDPENLYKFREAVEVIRRAWENETFSFEGEYYNFPTLRLRPRPVQKKAPLWIAATTVQSGEWAGQQGLPYVSNTWPIATLDHYREKNLAFRSAAADAGHDAEAFECPHLLFTYCAETDAEAERVAEHYMTQFQCIVEHHYERASGRNDENSRYAGLWSYVGEMAEERKRVEELTRYPIEHHLIGTPETILDRIDVFRREAGMKYLVCNVGWGMQPYEMTLQSMERLAKHVLPVLAHEPAPEALGL